ncbi:hypothetical protein DUNSADRAFT_5973 [Dunaliella salina]|uniref:Encoded protein n=1 Tax=Dunaliella salina TaxID=3046 RepID=A0ABQ7GP75_DUNSA|nr:hypothetical protein DUNSADRAFT_5973 [Dunaliella salina]|eukprot:KAF5836403.1 hypothetical protein DUNSADRAFT_5973 [Dunaliella salina]
MVKHTHIHTHTHTHTHTYLHISSHTRPQGFLTYNTCARPMTSALGPSAATIDLLSSLSDDLLGMVSLKLRPDVESCRAFMHTCKAIHRPRVHNISLLKLLLPG